MIRVKLEEKSICIHLKVLLHFLPMMSLLSIFLLSSCSDDGKKADQHEQHEETHGSHEEISRSTSSAQNQIQEEINLGAEKKEKEPDLFIGGSDEFLLKHQFMPEGATKESDPAILFTDLGKYQPVKASQIKGANDFYRQGLLMLYGFNFWEARRSFRKSVELDPSCLMCHWGYSTF